jgi:uncharacterized lipoprotein YbaY
MAGEPDGSGTAEGALVSGHVVIAGRSPALADASVHISLDDVSYADAPATTVAETVIHHVRHQPAESDHGEPVGTVLAFTVRPPPGAPVIDPRHHYAMRVWVDRDGDGKAGPGDLYSDLRYPVLTRGHGNTVTITLGPG